jgi:hypothetical protein
LVNGFYFLGAGANRAIFWLDSAGNLKPLHTEPGQYYHPAFSPDGKRLAFTVASGHGMDIWVQDLARCDASRKSFLPGRNWWPWGYRMELPLKKGRFGTMTHDYKRHGTATLFAALNVADGTVISMCDDRHRYQEWLPFLRVIDQVTPARTSWSCRLTTSQRRGF